MNNVAQDKPIFYPTCCFYPGTLLLLDDNQALLKNLSFALGSKYKCKCSTSSQETIHLIENQGNTIESFLQRYCTMDEYDLSPTTANVDIYSIKQELYKNPPRFNQIFILVVDYAMPSMNGLSC